MLFGKFRGAFDAHFDFNVDPMRFQRLMQLDQNIIIVYKRKIEMIDNSTQELIRAIRARQCVVVVGAGLSKTSGLPIWSELVGEMKQQLIDIAVTTNDKKEETKYLKNADFLDIATRFKFKLGLGRYYEFLQSKFRLKDVIPSETHKALARINLWPFIITTNFDKLLESAFTQPGRIAPTIVTELDELFVSVKSSEFFILKLHGDIDRPKSIVLTRDEYINFINEKRGQLLLDTLKQQLMFRTVLFLGFGLTDPNFLRVFGEVGWLASGLQGETYSIMAGTSKPEREEWQRRKLKIIPLKNHEDLTKFLNELADKVIGIGSDIVILNATNNEFGSPKDFLNSNPFFQVSSKWEFEFIREELQSGHWAFSAHFLDSDDIHNHYKTSFKELARTNHLLVTLLGNEIDLIPKNFWKRMPCNYDTICRYVKKENKKVFGITESNGLYTFLVAANDPDSLRSAMSGFYNLTKIPIK